MNENTHTKDLQSSYQAYAVAGEAVVRRFKIIRRNGEVISVPYSLLPVYILTGNQELLIKGHDFLITVSGRNLDKLEEALSEESLLYMRESGSEFDDGRAKVFISAINLEGDAITY